MRLIGRLTQLGPEPASAWAGFSCGKKLLLAPS